MTSIGPQIPAHLLRKRDEDKDEEEDEEEEEDAYMPDLPPDLKGSTAEISDDDDIGPKPARTSQADEGDDDPVREFIERESRRQKAQEKEKEPKKLQREEWMLVPPSSSSLLGSLDPTKIKARQFSRNPATAKSVESSLWTETPAEKQARIKDEVEGKRKRATDVSEDPELDLQEIKRSRHNEQLSSQVESYNREVRGTSLMHMHREKQEGKKKDTAEDVIWDHDRDMSVGGRLMDERQRSRMIHDAQALSSRFSRGKGGFL